MREISILSKKERKDRKITGKGELGETKKRKKLAENSFSLINSRVKRLEK